MKVLDLFCGCGGFSYGFEKAGHQIKYAIDNWKGCQETFEFNHSDTEFILSDVKEQNPKDFKGKVDGIIGGPPCQEFSNANNNPNPNKGLKNIIEFIEWVQILKPKFWLMENVPRIIPHLKKKIYFKFPLIKVFNCADFGVPQKRKRCFSGNYMIPIPTHNKVGQQNIFGEYLKKWVTVLDAIGDIMFIEPNQPVALGWFENSKKWRERDKPMDLNKPTHSIRTKMSEHHYFEVPNHKHPNFRLEIPNHNCFDNMKEINYESANREVKINEPTAVITSKDRCKKKLEIELTQVRNPFTSGGNSNFYKPNNPSRTITNYPHSIVKKKENKIYRRLTVRECARLQSFPDDFIFFGALSNQYKMVGNAVPPLMAYRLGKALKINIEVFR